jgi:FHS family glucose/mannose:H+ symporter-like MFS transporter
MVEADMKIVNSLPAARGPSFARALPLSIAFLLTGVATALLGAVLPVMLKQWNMGDRTGGTLLLLAWGGSTSGALLCRGNLRIAAAAGMLLTALSMLTIAGVDRKVVLPVFALYGIGLGVAMTSISLLGSRSLIEATRRRELMRLNLLWSVGACLAPTFATHALTFTRVGGLFESMGLVFCVIVIAIWFGSLESAGFPSAPEGAFPALHSAPVPLFFMAALAVGVESAIGGWLTTYAGRTAHSELVTISATTAFWTGLLLGRALHSTSQFHRLHTASVLIAHAALATLAAVTLLATPNGDILMLSAMLAGFGLGPLYPQVLTRVVGSYKPRAVFFVAGLGAAALPWLTGTVSHAAHSLRAGLILPCAGAAALFLFMLLDRHASETITPAA